MMPVLRGARSAPSDPRPNGTDGPRTLSWRWGIRSRHHADHKPIFPTEPLPFRDAMPRRATLCRVIGRLTACRRVGVQPSFQEDDLP
jgi:hypothetical protein